MGMPVGQKLSQLDRQTLSPSMQALTHLAYSTHGMLPKQLLYLATHRPSADFLEQSVHSVHVADFVSHTGFPDELDELEDELELALAVALPESSPP